MNINDTTRKLPWGYCYLEGKMEVDITQVEAYGNLYDEFGAIVGYDPRAIHAAELLCAAYTGIVHSDHKLAALMQGIGAPPPDGIAWTAQHVEAFVFNDLLKAEHIIKMRSNALIAEAEAKARLQKKRLSIVPKQDVPSPDPQSVA
jgi:hypothetical protein